MVQGEKSDDRPASEMRRFECRDRTVHPPVRQSSPMHFTRGAAQSKAQLPGLTRAEVECNGNTRWQRCCCLGDRGELVLPYGAPFSWALIGLKVRSQPSLKLNTDMLSTSIGSCTEGLLPNFKLRFRTVRCRRFRFGKSR